MTTKSDDYQSFGEPMPSLANARTLDKRLVEVAFRTGETRTVDLAPVLASRKLFAPLILDDLLFRQLSVNEDGNALEWPGGIELTALLISKLPSVA